MRLMTLLFVASTGALASGLTVHMKANGKDSAIYLDGDHVRTDSKDGTDMIFDAGTKTLIMLDDTKKTFSKSTAGEMAAAAAKNRERMTAAMSKMPPEQRKMMEAQMAKMTGAGSTETKNKWEPTGKDETIAGLACKGYKSKTASGPTEACLVPWGHGISKDDIKPMVAFSSMMRSMMGASSQRVDDFVNAPGFPAAQVIYGEDGKPIMDMRLQSLSHGSVPASRFAVPAGYSPGEKFFDTKD